MSPNALQLLSFGVKPNSRKSFSFWDVGQCLEASAFALWVFAWEQICCQKISFTLFCSKQDLRGQSLLQTGASGQHCTKVAIRLSGCLKGKAANVAWSQSRSPFDKFVLGLSPLIFSCRLPEATPPLPWRTAQRWKTFLSFVLASLSPSPPFLQKWRNGKKLRQLTPNATRHARRLRKSNTSNNCVLASLIFWVD